ncbi:MAG: dTDP-4-dehydrorhamnose 3,5-epimerase [FCB group bacterium]|nr:dTDP-4-dehydrorhamnose 3,5-epimerase [FCB group bacterium]
MKFIPTEIPDVILIKPDVFEDQRGYFMETYHETKFRKAGITPSFVQDNHAVSVKNVIRGLHYQLRHPQGKLVRVVSGRIFDVAVDIRKSSKFFGRWVGVVLSAENRHQLYIPEGFAHGYCSLSDITEVVYKCTDVYHPESDRGIFWNDPVIGIDWPVKSPVVSPKDRDLPLLSAAEIFD